MKLFGSHQKSGINKSLSLRLIFIYIVIILLLIFPCKVYSEPIPLKSLLPLLTSNVKNNVLSTSKIKKNDGKDSRDDSEERGQLLPIVTLKSKTALDSSFAISKEIVHVGFVISLMKVSAPFILAATDKFSTLIACSIKGFIKTTTSCMKEGPAFLEKFFCEEVFNSKYPFFEVRSEANRDCPRNNNASDATYQAVVLTMNSQKLLFFFSLITEFNFIPSRRLKSNPFIYYVASKYINRRKLLIIGSLLRGLQLSTGIENLFDPSIGACALINFGASWSGFGWIRSMVIGWTLSYDAWKICGTKRPKTPP